MAVNFPVNLEMQSIFLALSQFDDLFRINFTKTIVLPILATEDLLFFNASLLGPFLNL